METYETRLEGSFSTRELLSFLRETSTFTAFLESWALATRASFLESSGDNFTGQVKVITKEFNTFVGEVPIEILPTECFANITPALQRLKKFQGPKIRYINVRMFLKGKFFFGNKHSLLKNAHIHL